MKKILSLIILVSANTSLMAQEGSEVTGIDIQSSQSPFTSICVSATQSWDALDDALQEFGVTPFETNEIYCNDTPLMQFARESLRPGFYNSPKLVLRKTDDSVETQVCLDAVDGDSLSPENSSRKATESLRCNGMTVGRFVNTFSEHQIVEVL